MLPSSINERLSKNSSNETIFNISKIDYEKALKESGCKSVDLNYAKTTEKGTIIEIVTSYGSTRRLIKM